MRVSIYPTSEGGFFGFLCEDVGLADPELGIALDAWEAYERVEARRRAIFSRGGYLFGCCTEI